MALVKNLKAPGNKKALAKASKRVKSRDGRTVWAQRSRRKPLFLWFTPFVGKAARLLIADMQRRYGCKPAYGGCNGRFNGPLLARLRSDAYPPKFGPAVVKAARSQLGVVETPVNAGPALEKYYAVGWGGRPNPYGWCTWFAAWCWQQGLKAIGSHVKLGVQLGRVYMPNTGVVLAAAKSGSPHLKVVTRPKPGDWVCMFNGGHSGILEKVLGGGRYQTIEGNTSSGDSGSQTNGGGVYRRVRYAGQIDGFVRYVA